MRYVCRLATISVVASVCLFLGSTTEANKGNKPPECASTSGVASYYAGNFIGRKTASGQIFTSKGMTAAHKTLPFGTRLKLTNKKNGKSVSVVVNDRGPYIKGRILDLSEAAARRLDFVDQGIADIQIESCAQKSPVPAVAILRTIASWTK